MSIMVAGHELTGGARPRMMSANRYMLAQDGPNFLGECRTFKEPEKHYIRRRRWSPFRSGEVRVARLERENQRVRA
jgi:hypothetical protein